MKHRSSFFKLLAAAACAFTLGSCNRAEYALLPKSSSYHGVARVAASVPIAPAATPAPAEESAAAPVAAPTPPAAPIASVTPQSAASAAATPVAPKAATVAAAPAEPAAIVAPTPPRKLNLGQRLAVAKVGKQLRKAADLTQFKQKGAAAETQRISGNLRTGLILLLIGAILSIIPNLGLVGFIVVLIGVLFIALWLLDNL